MAEESHQARLAFLRRVASLFGVSVLIIAALSLFGLSVWPYDVVLVLTSMLLLSITRALAKGRFVEQRLSLAVSPGLLVGFAMLVFHFESIGWPVWVMGVGTACAITYTLVCGRDLSFLGMWFISIACSTILAFTFGTLLKVQPAALIEALAVNVAFLSYWVYDFAAILTRRRLGEEVGAVLDLYRDALNMFSYPLRVWEHWRTHKIWSRP